MSMTKYLVAGASALLSLGLVAQANQTPGPLNTPKPDDQKVVVVADPDASPTELPDVADDLREIYLQLKQLRAERLEERPRLLADRAARIYRDGVAAYSSDDEASAKSYGEAARALTRAIELSHRAVRVEQDDPDLPPPPPPRRRMTVRIAPKVEAKVKVKSAEALPPLLPVEGDDKATTTRSRTIERKAGSSDSVLKARVIQVPAKDLKVEERVIVTKEAGDGEEKVLEKKVIRLPKGGGSGSDPVEVIVRPPLEARRIAIETLRREIGSGSQRRGNTETFAYAFTPADSVSSARADLKRAYEKVRDARKNANADTKVYLDAARDLYNAARGDVEAGRYQRASELARAAEALTLVPKHLGSVRSRAVRTLEPRKRVIEIEKQKKAEGKDDDGDAPKVEIRVRKSPKDAEKTNEKGKNDSKSGEIRRFEYRITPPGRGESKADANEPKTRVGVGLALTEEDGSVIVQQLLPDGPAAKDGRIKVGDKILGIKGDDGEEILFEEKALAEVVRSISSGETGSKVALIVKPKDSDERKTVELSREKLELPANATLGEIPASAVERLGKLQGEQLKELQEQLKAGMNLNTFEELQKFPGLEGLKDLNLPNFRLKMIPGGSGGGDEKPAKTDKSKDQGKEKKEDLPPPL
jgi:hypothetical protein